MNSVIPRILTRQFSSSSQLYALQSALKDNFYNSEQLALQDTVKKVVEDVINPHADQWDKDKIFPAKEVYKKFGEAGLLGIHRPTEYGVTPFAVFMARSGDQSSKSWFEV